MDKIIIHELEIRMRVGTNDAERNWPQRLLATIELDEDMSMAMMNYMPLRGAFSFGLGGLTREQILKLIDKMNEAK